MINDIKLGIKIMRYGHGLLLSIIVGVWFLVIGIAVISMTVNGYLYNFTGGCFMIAAVLMPVQMIFSINTSNIVLSSPIRKKMQTVIPTAITCIGMLVLYLIVDLLLLINACKYPENMPRACIIVALQIIFAVFFMIYTPICYKYMVVAVIICIIVWWSCFKSFMYLNTIMYMPNNIFSFFDKGISSFLLISVLGLPIIAAAGFLQYLLSLLFYKAPVSKYSQNAFLRKEL